MGLFDGAADGTPSSTADVAQMLDAPVLLVVDCSAQAGSVAALVHGFATFEPRLNLAGVVLNRLASDGHERMVREALARMAAPVPVVGRAASRRATGVARPPPRAGAGRRAAADEVRRRARPAGRHHRRSCDLDAILAIAPSAAPLTTTRCPCPSGWHGARVAIAGGKAFTFAYPDNAEALAAAGAEIVTFDPLERRAAARTHSTQSSSAADFLRSWPSSSAPTRALLEDVRRRCR